MVYGVVKQSEGHVELRSAPGQGTTVTLWLPRLPSAAAEADPPAPPPDAVAGPRTVLLAEDEPMVRKLVAEVLRRGGYQVLEAEGVEAALAFCQAHAGPIDLLLTDVVMPGMSGRDLAQRVLRARPGTKVLYMSGYTEDDLFPPGAAGTEVAFIRKPFSPDALRRRVQSMLKTA
jgi:CheY-like chemotaxis protein